MILIAPCLGNNKLLLMLTNYVGELIDYGGRHIARTFLYELVL